MATLKIYTVVDQLVLELVLEGGVKLPKHFFGVLFFELSLSAACCVELFFCRSAIEVRRSIF